MTQQNEKAFNAGAINFDRNSGLVPAIIQDHHTARVLMMGYMDRQAVDRTLETGKVTFFSRSRQRLWTKGETSGNTLHLQTIQKDCDADTLLLTVEASGPACHKGEISCFHELQADVLPGPGSAHGDDAAGGGAGSSASAGASGSSGTPHAPAPSAGQAETNAPSGLDFLLDLEALLQDRRKNRPQDSYTGRMFEKGPDRIIQKVGEEAVETVIASKNADQQAFRYEASDLLFHLIMLLVEKQVPLQQLVSELERRRK